jgi:hypothetical protein
LLQLSIQGLAASVPSVFFLKYIFINTLWLFKNISVMHFAMDEAISTGFMHCLAQDRESCRAR